MCSKRKVRRKECVGKKGFSTGDEAAEERRRLSRACGYVGVIRTYRCRFCGMFHNGHPPKRKSTVAPQYCEARVKKLKKLERAVQTVPVRV